MRLSFIITAFTLFFSAKSHNTFHEWTKEYNVKFNLLGERMMRKSIFEQNLAKIERHNDNHPGWQMKMNQFGHLTSDEFKSTYLGLTPKGYKTPKGYIYRSLRINPEEVDWVKKGAVTPVKNQGACGSCWSFATTGALEGAYFVKYNKLVSFSEQELVACDKIDQGCNGGLMDNAFEYIQRNGLCSEEDYPYTAGSGFRGWCKKRTCTPVPNSHKLKYIDVDHNAISLESAVAKQPVAVAIEADELQFYSGGVMDSKCGTNLDHGVLLVGYGTDTITGQKYWLIKNSWGSTWGEQGYIKLARNVDQEGGECGILLSGSYPEFK